MALPHPGMVFSPFDILTAEEMNYLVDNIESLQDGSAFDNNGIGSDKLNFTGRIVVSSITTGTTSGTTILQIGTIVVPSQATSVYVDVSSYVTISNDTANDEFELTVRETNSAGAIVGRVRNRHQGGVNMRIGYVIPSIFDDASATSPYLLAASTSRTFSICIVRVTGSGVATVSQNGSIRALILPYA